MCKKLRHKEKWNKNKHSCRNNPSKENDQRSMPNRFITW